MSNDVRIAISGKSGCGNTTVSRIVAKTLGLKLVNYTFHDLADEQGISFEELCRLAEIDERYDRELDKTQVRLAAGPGVVLGSRLAIWLLTDADLKVYLDGPPEVRAARIAGREGTTVEEALEQTTERDNRDRERYIRLYGIDIDDYDFADLIVDTARGNQNYVASRILDAVAGLEG
jgi:cytidylate kinase